MNEPKERLIVELGGWALPENRALVEKLLGVAECFLVGNALYLGGGREVMRPIQARGGRVLLDLGLYHPIETMVQTIRKASELGVWGITVNALGGEVMLSAAVTAAADRMHVYATTLSPFSDHTAALISRMVHIARDVGCAGAIITPAMTDAVRDTVPPGSFRLVTTSVRAPGVSDSLSGTMTVAQALAAGADAIVVEGLHKVADPCATVMQILSMLRGTSAASVDAAAAPAQ